MPSTRPGTSVDLACGLFWYLGHESVACVEKDISSVAAEPGFVHLKMFTPGVRLTEQGMVPRELAETPPSSATCHNRAL